MNLSIKDSDTFKKIFDSIKDLDIVDTNFEFSKDGLIIENMDSSHTSLVYLLLSKDYFESYTCDSHINVGLNIPIFCKILKASRGNDLIHISKVNGENFLSIKISNDDKNQEFEVPQMEIDTNKLLITDNYSYKINMKSDIFCRLINDISLVEGSNVNIQLVEGSKLKWSSVGDLGKTSLETRSDEIILNEISGNRLTSNYSINFLKKFIKSSYLGLDGNISLSLDNEIPIKLTSKLSDKSEIKYYIAPKID